MKDLKVSIITVCYNSEKTIKDTIDSVVEQTYHNIEHILVDGVSTDNTLSIIEDYKKNSKDVVFVSEKDDGIYDAMNKGIKIATGDIIGILNSDDFLASDNIIQQIVNVFNSSQCDGSYGNINYVDECDIKNIKRKWVAGNGKFENGWSFGHASFYLKREIYEEYGLYKTHYKISSDYDLMLRLYKNGENLKFAYINEYIMTMRNGGESTRNLKSNIIAFKEAQESLKEYGFKYPTCINIMRVLRKIKQFS